MENLNFMFHALGTIAILWIIHNLLHLWQLTRTFEYRKLNVGITVKPQFFYPFILLIFYLFWLFS